MHLVIAGVWVSEWVSVRPFLWLSGSAQGSRARGRMTSRGFKDNGEVSSAFVTTRSFFYSFYGFLRNINLRSRLTIFSNLNCVGR